MYTAILIGGPRDKEVMNIQHTTDKIPFTDKIPCYCTCSIGNRLEEIDLSIYIYNLYGTIGNTAIYIFNGVKL